MHLTAMKTFTMPLRPYDYDLFEFPPIEEERHRFARYKTFHIALCIAILPFTINTMWRSYTGDNFDFRSGITDLAFANVVIAISTYTNTYFSGVKLLGWKSMTKYTFSALMIVSIIAVISFSAYLVSVHEFYDESFKELETPVKYCLYYFEDICIFVCEPIQLKLFLSIFFSTIAITIYSFAAHYLFISDEIRDSVHHIHMMPKYIELK